MDMLKVEWVGEPVVNTNGTITVNVKFSRGTNNPNFQNDVSDLVLFVNATPYVANNNYDNRYSNKMNFSDTAGNDMIGQKITLTTTK